MIVERLLIIPRHRRQSRELRRQYGVDFGGPKGARRDLLTRWIVGVRLSHLTLFIDDHALNKIEVELHIHAHQSWHHSRSFGCTTIVRQSRCHCGSCGRLLFATYAIFDRSRARRVVVDVCA